MKTKLPTTEMRRAFAARDTAYDGLFFIAVRSTGIFCRPSCPARRPLPENVEFFSTGDEASKAGYRPCMRCRPLQPDGSAPVWLERLMRTMDRDPARRITDGDLRSMDIDPASVRRYFRSRHGMTFQAYHRARRMGSALTQLQQGENMLHVAYDHGYESSSGFNDAFRRMFGESPGRGRQMRRMATSWTVTPLGPMVMAAVEEGVCLLEFFDRRSLPREMEALRKHLHCTPVPGSNSHIERLKHELEQYFAGSLTKFGVPLVTPGTPFQREVWKHLLEIPHGETCSYEEMARRIGREGAQRAVGAANGANRVAVVIPCHRVVQKDGQLRGYGGGLWRKQFLLDHERKAQQWIPSASAAGRVVHAIGVGSR